MMKECFRSHCMCCICWQKHIICTISVSRSHGWNKFNKLTYNKEESLQFEGNNCHWFSVPLDDNTYVSDAVSLGFRSCGMTVSVTGWLVADVLKEMLSHWQSVTSHSDSAVRSQILHSASCCFVCIIVGGIQYNWGISTLNDNQRDHSKLRFIWWFQEGAAKSEHQNTESSWSSDSLSMKCGLREQGLIFTVRSRGHCEVVVCHFLIYW